MKLFVIPDDVGGRFSVLTSGLLPIKCNGVNIDELMEEGARLLKSYTAPFEENDCYKYAAIRNILNKRKEYWNAYQLWTKTALLGEWWKQLFGESEGKDGKDLPSSSRF